MKYISNGKYDKNMTRTLEEYAYEELGSDRASS